jgi:hypothetical protein
MNSGAVEDPAPPSGEEPPVERPVTSEALDRTAELDSTLNAEFAADSRQTRESQEKEKAIEGLFSKANLGDKGHLQEIICRETICRGTVSITSRESDREVFERTFLSPDFARAVSDAVTVASREEMSDGTLLATFFIHPQSVFDMISP